MSRTGSFRTLVGHRLRAILGERRLATLQGRMRLLSGILRPVPLRAKTPWRPAPFFIIGSGRSGTTLLRAMLCRHPAVCIPPELEVTGSLAQDFLRINALPWQPLSRLCLARLVAHPDFGAWNLETQDLFRKVARFPIEARGLDRLLGCVYEAYRDAHKPAAGVIGDKTPLNSLYLDWLDGIFPNARYIHVVRDGRAVVESFVRNWGDLHDERSVLKGCEIWRERTQRARQFCFAHDDGRSLEVRYEELVTDPHACLHRVSNLLGIDFHDEMLDHRPVFADLGDTMTSHMKSLAGPLTMDQNEKWRNLPKSTQSLISGVLEDELRELGYL